MYRKHTGSFKKNIYSVEMNISWKHGSALSLQAYTELSHILQTLYLSENIYISGYNSFFLHSNVYARAYILHMRNIQQIQMA